MSVDNFGRRNLSRQSRTYLALEVEQSAAHVGRVEKIIAFRIG